MITEDWRILPWHGDIFTGLTLLHRRWTADAANDHDHCAFCWEKFAEYDGCQREGYCTEDRMYWICRVCFNDFREHFGWRIQVDG